MDTFSSLKDCVWMQRGLKRSTKLEVYKACELTGFLYSCESWVVYWRHLKQLVCFFHQHCLILILSIHWVMHVTGTEFWEKVNMISLNAYTQILTSLDGSLHIAWWWLYSEAAAVWRTVYWFPPLHKPKKHFISMICYHLNMLERWLKITQRSKFPKWIIIHENIL